MDTPSALSTELLDALRVCLDNGKFKEALELPGDNRYAAALKDNCWDLIPHLISRLQDDTIITWPALQRCCERLLLVVADKANPEEVLLELIEQAEIAKNDAQFISTLLPLQSVLKRLSKKRGRSLEWCLNTLHTYVLQLPLPEEHDFSDRERLLMDSDTNTRRIIKIYSELPTFYDYFIKEVSRNPVSKHPTKDVLVCFLIDLLGKPLALLDLELDNKTKSHCRVHAENIFKDICFLEPNLFKFLEYAEKKCYPKAKADLNSGVYEDAPDDIFLLDEKLTPISLGILYYLLLTEKLPAPSLPQVYSPQYICLEALCLATFLLSQEQNMIRHKGIRLARTLLQFLPDASPAALLSLPAYPALARNLTFIAVYCPAETLRKQAVVLIKEYIFKFNDQGRYLLILNLLPTIEHSGMKGYIVTIYKEVLMEALKSQDEEKITWFKGQRLQEILRTICTLTHGTESDLVESADHIISALNLLRFLILRDVDNTTGVWNTIKNLQTKYLSPLRQGLDMSRAHYEIKLMEISQTSGEKMDFPEMSVTVSGSVMDNLPPQNQKEIINSALNALHLIDSLLCRLQECINLVQPSL